MLGDCVEILEWYRHSSDPLRFLQDLDKFDWIVIGPLLLFNCFATSLSVPLGLLSVFRYLCLGDVVRNSFSPWKKILIRKIKIKVFDNSF